MMNDNTFPWHYFLKDTVIGIIHAIWPMHDKSPMAIQPHITFMKRIGKPFRSPPTGQLLRGSPSVKDGFPRKTKQVRIYHFIFSHKGFHSTTPYSVFPNASSIIFVPCSRTSGESCPS